MELLILHILNRETCREDFGYETLQNPETEKESNYAAVGIESRKLKYIYLFVKIQIEMYLFSKLQLKFGNKFMKHYGKTVPDTMVAKRKIPTGVSLSSPDRGLLQFLSLLR